MPSARQTFFMPEDENDFSEAMKEKFPDVIFIDSEFWAPDEFPVIGSIGEAKEWRATIVVPPPGGWEPEWGIGKISDYPVVLNSPELCIVFHRSTHFKQNQLDKQDDDVHWTEFVTEGVVNISHPPPASREQRSFRGKVWRIIEKMATCRLKSLGGPDPENPNWIPIGGKIFWAGHHAVRWALEDESRYFRSSMKTRPLVD